MWQLQDGFIGGGDLMPRHTSHASSRNTITMPRLDEHLTACGRHQQTKARLDERRSRLQTGLNRRFNTALLHR